MERLIEFTDQRPYFPFTPEPLSTPDPVITGLVSALRAALDSPALEELARHTLKRIRQIQGAVELTDVIDHVEREFRMEMGTLRSRHKTQRIALARQIAYYLCRTITSSSLPVIGEALGRDHSSVHHGFNLIRHRMQRDAAFRLAIEKLQHQITGAVPSSTAAAA